MPQLFRLILLCAASLSLTAPTFAETPEEKGLKIARQMEAANKGFIGERARMRMILIDAHGSRVEREMTGMVMEAEGDGDRSLMSFETPLDVQGTKMLTWSKKNEDDDQWLYIPSVRRVKRITSRQQSSSFLGSEFSFEDLGSQEVEKYNYKFLRDEKRDGRDIWVLERVPKRTSGYSKQIMYVRQDILSPVQVDYYDRRNELLKIATFDGYRTFTVNGRRIHRPSSIHMKNVQTRKESIFDWNERELGVKHNPVDFEQRNLR
jgi:outer membrane lipoprotein-sorting protein